MRIRGKRLICGGLSALMCLLLLCGCAVKYGQVDEEKAELINRNNELKRENTEKDQTISDLNSLIESLNKSVEDLQKEAEGLKDTIKSLEESIDVFENDSSGSGSKIAELEKTVADLQAQIEAQNELIVELENKKLIEFDPSIPYHTMYPDLYAELADEVVVPEGKTVYLTFDDGPSDRTDEILAILDQYNIKATFFVVPRRTDECFRRLRAIVDAGHTIGVHTYSHDYSIIYASVESYLDDFYKAYELIVEATGVKPDIFRFAGGSLNDKTYKIIAEMTRRGFTYYDWNASGDDSVSDPPPTVESITQNSISWVMRRQEAVLLLHDEKKKTMTVEALPTIIETLMAEGYNFLPMNNQVTLYQQRKLK